MGLSHNALDYRNALIALSPTGACWPTDADSNWVKLLDAIAQEFARVDGRTVDLFNEGFPNTSTELLSNWERIVGLPDALSDPVATVEERRAAVVFKLRARGGQSAQYFESLIDALGHASIVFGSLTSDESSSGDYLLDDTWQHYFLVVVDRRVPHKVSFEARISAVAPAHSKAIFYYLEGAGIDEIRDLIFSTGVDALVYDGASMTSGIALADDFIFDSSWAGYFLIIVQNPVADHAAFEALILDIQPNCIFYYVDDLTDF